MDTCARLTDVNCSVMPKGPPAEQLAWEVVDDYLWYELGGIEHLDEAEMTSIKEQCFEHDARFGDIELHRSVCLPGNPVVLRLRGKLRLLPVLEIRGHSCPLYRVGNLD